MKVINGFKSLGDRSRRNVEVQSEKHCAAGNKKKKHGKYLWKLFYSIPWIVTHIVSSILMLHRVLKGVQTSQYNLINKDKVLNVNYNQLKKVVEDVVDSYLTRKGWVIQCFSWILHAWRRIINDHQINKMVKIIPNACKCTNAKYNLKKKKDKYTNMVRIIRGTIWLKTRLG